MFRKKDVILIGSILLAAAVLFGITALTRHAPGDTVLILLDGKEYERVPLAVPTTLTINCGDGQTNVLVIDGNAMHMQSATCRDQLCVGQGTVSPDNYAQRALGTDIICLPHRLVCTLVPQESDTLTVSVPDN